MPILRFSYGQRGCSLSPLSVCQVYRHWQNPKGHDWFSCRDCYHMFLLTYTYEAVSLVSKNKLPKWPST
ncbi:hypothetical protein I1A41_08410, partial [Pectobacterium carotovorum]|nr:hypothetical protein [Pectobacterium carotovorum]